MVATRLAPRRMYLCASPSYVERYGRPHSLSELSRHNCLIGSSDLWQLEQNGREFSQRVQGNWRCNSGQAVLDAALQGVGLCQLPDYYVLEHLHSGALISLLEAHQPPNTAVWALYSAAGALPARTPDPPYSGAPARNNPATGTTPSPAAPHPAPPARCCSASYPAPAG